VSKLIFALLNDLILNMKFFTGCLVLSIVILFSCGDSKTTDGDAFFSKGQYKEAIDAYNKHLESNSSDVKTLYNRGRAYQELKMIDLAEADFTSVLKSDDKNVSAYLSLSKLYYDQANYNKAVLWADQALSVSESSAQAHFLAARSRHQLGYVDAARESYTMAIKIDPNFGEAYLYRGALKIHLGRTKDACEDFRKAEALEVAEASAIRKKYCN
jgi:tetratricopeptide (TPR) repeat protein